MRLSPEDSSLLSRRLADGTASEIETHTAVELLHDAHYIFPPINPEVTLEDAKILTERTIRKVRIHEANAAEGHCQTAVAMQDLGGSVYDFDGNGEPVTFMTWRELVALETEVLEHGYLI